MIKLILLDKNGVPVSTQPTMEVETPVMRTVDQILDPFRSTLGSPKLLSVYLMNEEGTEAIGNALDHVKKFRNATLGVISLGR